MRGSALERSNTNLGAESNPQWHFFRQWNGDNYNRRRAPKERSSKFVRSICVTFCGFRNYKFEQWWAAGNGSDIGVTAQQNQSSAGANVSWGTLPGQWLDPRSAISDPFATIPAPSSTGMVAGTVTYGQKTFPECSDGTCGCPDLTDGCDHYHP